MSLILAVDDNPTNLLLLEKLLSRLPEVESVCLEDPHLALEWCQENRPDLILLDYMMPGLDGLEFLRQLYRIPERGEHRGDHDHRRDGTRGAPPGTRARRARLPQQTAR